MKLGVIYFLVSLCISSSHAQQNEGASLRIMKLRENFFIYTTWQNYGGTVFPSNGMYIITDAGAILIDCPWDSTQWQPLLDSIQNRHKQKVVLSIATHFHKDRAGAFNYYKHSGIATWTSADTKKLCIQRNEPQAEFVFQNDTTFHIGNLLMKAYYPGRGHTSDNIVLWFAEEKILYGGCLVKSSEANDLGNINDADVRAWPATIQKLISKYPDRKFVIPGHQSWSDGKGLEHTLKLLSAE